MEASNRLRTRYDIGTKQVLLQINDVRPDDVGTYRVVATNPAGQASTAAKLNIIPGLRGVDSQPFIEPEKFLNLKPIPTKEKLEEELKQPKRPPKVIVPLADTVMEEQMPVIFTTTIDAGIPMATVNSLSVLTIDSDEAFNFCNFSLTGSKMDNHSEMATDSRRNTIFSTKSSRYIYWHHVQMIKVHTL